MELPKNALAQNLRVVSIQYIHAPARGCPKLDALPPLQSRSWLSKIGKSFTIVEEYFASGARKRCRYKS